MQSPKKCTHSQALIKIKRGSLGETYFLKIANMWKSCSLIAFRLLKKAGIRPKIYGLNNVAMVGNNSLGHSPSCETW